MWDTYARNTRKEGRKEEEQKKKRGGRRRGEKRRERFHFSPPQAPLGFREIRTRFADLCNSVYRKLVEATPEATTMVSFSAMLAILQERLNREVKREHDRTIAKLNDASDNRHEESKAMITQQRSLTSRRQSSRIFKTRKPETAQSWTESKMCLCRRTDLKLAAVELLPLACTSCTLVCTPEAYKQSAVIIEGIRR